jgi:hypothetical protein
MNPDTAMFIGGFIQAAYQDPPGNLAPPAPGLQIQNYSVLSKIYGNDLATDISPGRGGTTVSLGYLLQNNNGNVVIAIRGTEGIWEWFHDAMFLLVPCPIDRSIGFTEDGFSTIYRSMRLAQGAPTPLRSAIASYPFPTPVTSVTVCGHSLGGALATLLAFDLAANTNFNVTVYTYASPRTGDPLFAANYNHVVQNSFRIANRADIVPKMPFPPLYEHVNLLGDLNPIDVATGKSVVNFTVPCEHSLTTYLYLLSQLPYATSQQVIDPTCAASRGGLPTGLIGLL